MDRRVDIRRTTAIERLIAATNSMLCSSVIAARRANEIIEGGYRHTMEQKEKVLALTAFTRSTSPGGLLSAHAG